MIWMRSSGKEHMLRPTESDPFGTETSRDLRLIRHIRIGADSKRAHSVGP